MAHPLPVLPMMPWTNVEMAPQPPELCEFSETIFRQPEDMNFLHKDADLPSKFARAQVQVNTGNS